MSDDNTKRPWTQEMLNKSKAAWADSPSEFAQEPGSLPLCSMLKWREGDDKFRGYLRNHPETTLFIIQRHPSADGMQLLGAFVPDAEETEVWCVSGKAKAAAEGYLLDWLALTDAWRYSHGEIEAACGGETALDVRHKVLKRREAIRSANKEVSDGGPLTSKSKPNANPPFAGPTR